MIEKREEKKPSKLEVMKRIEAARERDHELVSGIFRFLEHPKGRLHFRFKKYAHDDYKQYELVDGERYKLPRMVARHLNQNVYYIEYKRMDNDPGLIQSAGAGVSQYSTGGPRQSSNMHIQEKVRRCEFRPLEFMDDDLDPSSIVEVVSKS
jgi:hypothetical protein